MSIEKKSPKLLICVNRRFGLDTPSCAMRGSEKILEDLKNELYSREIYLPLEKFMCMGQCSKGPALRMAPGGGFFLGAKKDQISEIADWVVSELDKIEAKEKED